MNWTHIRPKPEKNRFFLCINEKKIFFSIEGKKISFSTWNDSFENTFLFKHSHMHLTYIYTLEIDFKCVWQIGHGIVSLRGVRCIQEKILHNIKNCVNIFRYFKGFFKFIANLFRIYWYFLYANFKNSKLKFYRWEAYKQITALVHNQT